MLLLDKINDVKNSLESFVHPFQMQPRFFFFAVGTLEETLKLSDEEFKEKFERNKPTTETEIIFSCKLGGRASKAAEVATTLGFEKSKVFKGSWTEWAAHKNLN